jgi:hypothetical protein
VNATQNVAVAVAVAIALGAPAMAQKNPASPPAETSAMAAGKSVKIA